MEVDGEEMQIEEEKGKEVERGIERGRETEVSEVETKKEKEKKSKIKRQTRGKELPQKTLYIRNLDTSISISKLKRYLYLAFIPYGRIIDINASAGMNKKKLKSGLNLSESRVRELKLTPMNMNHVNLTQQQQKIVTTSNLRGQAWIVYENVINAQTAKDSLQDTLFFDSPLEIYYALNKSKATHLKEGTFTSQYMASRSMQQHLASGAGAGSMYGPLLPSSSSSTNIPTITPSNSATSASFSLGNKTIFTCIVKNLPLINEITTENLRLLFDRFENLRDLRLMFDRGICFVDFSNERSAKKAIESMNGFRIGDNEIEVSMAR